MTNSHWRRNPRLAAARKVRLDNLTDEDRQLLEDELLGETMKAANSDKTGADAKLLTTAADIALMTPDEINANWETVSRILADPDAWEEGVGGDDEAEETPPTTELAALQKKLASMSPEQADRYVNQHWDGGDNILGILGRASS